MNSKEFNALLEAQLERVQAVLNFKAEEYASQENDDRLHNFRQAAGILQTTLRGALGGFMVKHTVSLYDMIESDEEYPMELWEEKITDHINYLLLLNAVVKEEELERKGLGGGSNGDAPKSVGTRDFEPEPIPTASDFSPNNPDLDSASL
jgi:hypothetical protein